MTPLNLPAPNDRTAAIEFVKSHAPWAEGCPSPIKGGYSEAQTLMLEIDAPAYAKSRNHLDGAVSRLSPFIRHGVLSANTVRNYGLDKTSKGASERFLQQLAWRYYWQRLYRQNPNWIWNNIEGYKTGFEPFCHWRRVKWQAGARWMMKHLLDGDPASNNLSWQWVASTFANKPYFFNLDNVRKYSGSKLDTSIENNQPLDGSYELLHNRLFPNVEPRS